MSQPTGSITDINGTPGNVAVYQSASQALTARSGDDAIGYLPSRDNYNAGIMPVYNPAVHLGVPLISPVPFVPAPDPGAGAGPVGV